LSDAGQRSPLVNREVSSALARSNLSSEQVLQALGSTDPGARMPIQQAERARDEFNQLALSLLETAQQIGEGGAGSGMQEALDQLGQLAQEQGALSGQSSALMPMDVSPELMQRQLEGMSRQQQEIAGRLEGTSNLMGRREG